MKKAFTLIELLAVIAILAIILLIAMPIFSNILDNVRKNTAESSAKGLYKAAQLTHSNNIINDVATDVVYTFTDGNISSSVPSSQLTYSSGDKYDGNIRLKKDGTVMMNLYNGTFCVKKSYNDNIYTIIKNTKEECLTAVENPELALMGMSHFKIPINGTYNELGFEAYDIIDGDLTSSVSISGTVNPNVEGIYPITYTITDSDDNVDVAVRNVEVVDIYNLVDARYAILEVNDHYGSNSAIINEIDIFDNNLANVPYTIVNSYESNRSGIPYYWNDGIWDKTNLNDNNLAYDMANSTILLYDTAPNTNAWNRIVLDFGSTKTISSVEVNSGSSDLRIPHNVKVYLANSYDNTANIVNRSNAGLTYIGETLFDISNTTNVMKNVSTIDNSIEISKQTSSQVIGSLKLYVNGIVNNDIAEIKVSFGNRNKAYFATGGTVVQNGFSYNALQNGTYTAYLRTVNGTELISTISVNNIDEGPAITLNGAADAFVILNSSYNEQGATAFDLVDNEAKTVTITGTVDTSVEGDYEVHYSAADDNGTISTKTRNVKVSASIYDLGNYGNVYYVSTTGNDTTGTGTKLNPYLTISKAYTSAVDGDAIYIKGNYNISSVLDLTKNVDFLGNYLTDGSKITMNNYRLLALNMNKTAKFYGIYLESTGLYEIFDGYRGAYVNKGNIELHNCVVKNTNSARNIFIHLQSMKMYNTLLIANITENQTTYTANATYVNVATTGVSVYPGNNSTVTTTSTSVTYNATTFAITSAGWQNTGTGLNRNGEVAHRGVYGGPYGW